jgi:hypothetical protein
MLLVAMLALVSLAGPRRLPVAVQAGQGRAVRYLTSQPVELGAAAAGGVLPGVEQADPQASGPGVCCPTST